MVENKKEFLKKKLLAAGAIAVGFAKAGEIDSSVIDQYEKWIGEGMNAEMDYLNRHSELRKHTDNVLKDAKTVISLAFSYISEKQRDSELPMIAGYALVADYHKTIRKILNPCLDIFKKKYGGQWRLCIDSAPVAERYWALKAGIGKRGLNGSVIVEGCGSYCFLAELLTTIEIDPDFNSEMDCGNCRECVAACPGKALNGDGTIDCNRCISYLTIEKKYDFSEEERRILSSLKNGKKVIFGCDICLQVCPHNRNNKPVMLKEFSPLEDVLHLTPEIIENMDDETFKIKFDSSSLKRTGLLGLKKNIAINDNNNS